MPTDRLAMAEGDGVALGGVRLFEPPPSRRRFSAGDGLRLVIGIVLLGVGVVLATVAEKTIGGAEADVVEAFSQLPDRIEQAIVGVAQLAAGLVPIALVVVIAWSRRWRLLLSLFVASNVASWATAAVEAWLGERESAAVLADRTISSAWLADPSFPTTPYLAAAAALVTVAGPWLSRRWVRAAWLWVLVLVLLRVLGSGEPVLDIGMAVAMGVVVGSLTLLLVGSPNPEPGPLELLRGLQAAGFAPTAIVRADAVSPTFLVEEVERPTSLVKVRTPDDRSSDLLNRLYRAVRLRSSEIERPYSTLKRRVEHEALLLREAAVAGARCPQLVGMGATDGGSVFLATEHVAASRASELAADHFDDALLADVWSQLGALHRARIAHQAPGLDNIAVEQARSRSWLVNLSDAELAASERQRARDVAELLVDLSLVVGHERAVESAIGALGEDAVAATLPQLQPLALTGTVRRRLKGDKAVLDRLRAEIQRRTGAPDVPLDRLERVSPRTLVMIIAASMAFYSLLPQLANVGDTVDAFGDARIEWLPAVLVASAATYAFATMSFLGSVAQPVPVTSSARLGVASSFAGLVGPATTGSMTLAVRFLQRAGVDTTDASASVALNSVAGVVAHLVLMFSFFAWTGSAGVGGFSLPEANTILLVVAAVLVVIAVVMVLGPIRRRVLRPVAETLRRATSYLATVFRSPTRILALLGGSSLVTLSYVAALIFSVEAFGGGLSVPQIGAAYLGAAAIANVAPTPGGLGALEAATVAGLTGFGLGDGQAVSAVLTFRLATFWLPVLPGWLTFVWMQRNDEI